MSYEPSVHSLWIKALQNVLLLILNLSIASTSIILHLMSRSLTALVPLNIPFLETLSIPILGINHHASAGICSHIPAESARVSYSNISLHQWNRYYLQTNTDVRYRSLAPTGTEDAAWMKLSLEPDSVWLYAICCDVHKSLWKSTLTQISCSPRTSTFRFFFFCELLENVKLSLGTCFKRLWADVPPPVLCICFLWIVQHICTAGAFVRE